MSDGVGKYSIGERVAWKAINRGYSGEVIGFDRAFAVVLVDGTGRHCLLQNEPIKPTRR